MTVFSSGISMYAMAKLIQTLHVFDAPVQRMGLPLSWVFHAGILVSAVVVLAYIFLGGLYSGIYNEVLQFFLIVAGFLPLVWLGLRNVGGWSGLKARLDSGYTHSWIGMGSAHTNRLGVEWFGLAMGLGFVLSFGSWCTDFLVVQRAMAADSMSAARRTPLVAAFPKMIMPFIVILPGIAALALSQMNVGYAFPMKEGGGGPDYDLALTTLMAKFYPTALLGVGLTGRLAGTTAAAVTHGLTVAEGKGGWISTVHTFPSTMAQNFWMAIFAWSFCFLVTIVVSLMTPAKPEEELRGLVYGLTDVPSDV